MEGPNIGLEDGVAEILKTTELEEQAEDATAEEADGSRSADSASPVDDCVSASIYNRRSMITPQLFD